MKKNNFLKILCAVSVICSITALNSTKANAEWRQANGKWWYSEGNSWSTGWKLINSNWYYFGTDGYMKTGWLSYNGNRYYLYPNGKMASNEVIAIDGKYSKFNANGQWIGYVNNTTTESENTISKTEFTKIVCDEMHKLVNNHRKANGVQELEISSDLDNSAYLKSKHMVDNSYFAHDYNGQSFSDLVYSLSEQEINGENIAQNYLRTNSLTKSSAENLAQKLFTQWKESPGHNANMLRDSFDSFGFGFEIASNGYVYATQHFKTDY